MTRCLAALALTLTACWTSASTTTKASTAPAAEEETDDTGYKLAVGAMVLGAVFGTAGYIMLHDDDDERTEPECHEPFGYWQPDNGQSPTYCK